MSTFNRNGVVAALVGALALLSGCGSGQSTSTAPTNGSFGITPGTGGGSAVGCVPLNPQSTVIGVQASGYLSPLLTASGASYGINYNQVALTSVPQGFSYRFFTANRGDGLYLRFPDTAASMANSTRIPVSGDIGVVVIGAESMAMIQSMFGGSYYGSSNLCVASIQSIWAFGTQGADIVGPKVLMTIQGPGGVRQFEMYGF
jgi:hypothetical protein